MPITRSPQPDILTWSPTKPPEGFNIIFRPDSMESYFAIRQPSAPYDRHRCVWLRTKHLASLITALQELKADIEALKEQHNVGIR